MINTKELATNEILQEFLQKQGWLLPWNWEMIEDDLTARRLHLNKP